MKTKPFQLSFCLETLFTEWPFLERFEAAKACGITGIEFWDYTSKDLDVLQKKIFLMGMQLHNFSGNRIYGMVNPNERDAFLSEVKASIGVAERLRCPRLMLLVQPLREDGTAEALPAAHSEGDIFAALVQCGRYLAELAERAGIDFVIEPLNTVVDHPNYFLNHSQPVFQLMAEIAHPRIKVLYDIYHMAMMGEAVLADLENHLEQIGYLHIADAPGRGEPGSGRIDYRRIVELLKRRGYDRPIGFEFYPTHADSARAIRKTMELFG